MRTLSETWNEDEAPDKAQKILSICVCQGASDKRVEVSANIHDDDLKVMAEEYQSRNAAGECFVHIRKQHSSNKDVRALSGLTKGNQFYKVNLEGEEAKSVLTNSARLAKIIEASNCSNSEDVIREMEKEIKGDDWERDKRGFEQHMLEEDRVRVDWKSGKFEQKMACHTCGDKTAWG